MVAPFPAILIGGPPHSGKSVLVYSLTRALREAGVPHYVLRACPDGEGDWSNEAERALVQTIRVKGEFTAAFTERVIGYLQKRHLPLLVDVGGKPTPAQEALFGHCTQAILVVGERVDDKSAYARDLAEWQAKMARQQVSVIAEIRSVLPGDNYLVSAAPIVRGTVANLERGRMATGAAFAALVEKVAALFAMNENELARIHLAQAPAEVALDLPRLARTLGSTDGLWQPEQLAALHDYLPAGKPLALYGRAPNWIYAMLALQAGAAPVWLFDARLGWVEPPRLPVVAGGEVAGEAQAGWGTRLQVTEAHTLLEMITRSQYLDIDNAGELPLPEVAAGKGLIVSGKVPNWLLMAAVRQLAPAVTWLAIYQPPLGGAVVVHSEQPLPALGQVLS